MRRPVHVRDSPIAPLPRGRLRCIGIAALMSRRPPRCCWRFVRCSIAWMWNGSCNSLRKSGRRHVKSGKRRPGSWSAAIPNIGGVTVSGGPPSRIRVKTGHRDVPAEFLSPLHWSVMIGFVCMEQFDLSTQDVFIRVEKGLRERYPSLSATGEPHWD